MFMLLMVLRVVRDETCLVRTIPWRKYFEEIPAKILRWRCVKNSIEWTQSRLHSVVAGVPLDISCRKYFLVSTF